jgi:3'(2'), 5'-bisphosphate nucleotidase
MSTPYQTERDFALEAVVRAAGLCRQVQAEMVRPLASQKDDRTPVTVADYGSQAFVCQSLAAVFPGDPVVAEETAEALRRPDQAEMLAHVTRFVREVLPDATPAGICDWIDHGQGAPAARFWTLDPIDGTKGFVRGEQYAIALALIVGGRVQVGVLACPNLTPWPPSLSGKGGSDSPPLLGEGVGERSGQGEGVVFVAVRGQGAAMLPLGGDGPPRPIHVVAMSDQAAARFAESFEPAHADRAAHQALARALGITQPPLRMDSQAKYGVVARGEATLYLRLPSPQTPDYRENIWDHAAGVLLVEEAGGRVTDALGADLDFGAGRKLARNRGVIVSNGQLHEAILSALASG